MNNECRDITVVIHVSFNEYTERTLIENEKRKREEAVLRDIGEQKIDRIKEFCYLENNEFKYFYLLFMTDKTTISSVIYNLRLKPGYTGQIPWMPFYKQISFHNFVGPNEFVKIHLHKINFGNSLLNKLIGPNLADIVEFGPKQTFLFINDKFITNSDKDEVTEPFKNSLAPYILLNNLVPYSNILNFQALTNNVVNSQMALEITAKKLLFPTFIFAPPIIGIIETVLELTVKNVYYPHTDVHKKFGFLTNNKQNSFKYIMLLESMKSSQKILNIVPNTTEEYLDLFDTYSKSIFNWYINEIKINLKEKIMSSFFTSIPTGGVPNLVPFNNFKDMLALVPHSKIVNLFYKINAEYTTRLLHLYEIYILKSTGVERVYKTADEIQIANLKNERLHWKRFTYSPHGPTLLNEFRREYSGYTPTHWDTLLTSINVESMPYSIKKENSIYEPDESLEEATMETNILTEDTKWIINRRIEEIIGWINRTVLNVEEVAKNFSDSTLTDLYKIVSILQNDWKNKCLKEMDQKRFAMIFIYLLFLDFAIEDVISFHVKKN